MKNWWFGAFELQQQQWRRRRRRCRWRRRRSQRQALLLPPMLSLCLHPHSQSPLVVAQTPTIISTMQTYHTKHERIPSQRSALCLLFILFVKLVLCACVYSDFLTWIKAIRKQQCRITLPMRCTHFPLLFQFVCLFLSFSLCLPHSFFTPTLCLRQNGISHLYAWFVHHPKCWKKAFLHHLFYLTRCHWYYMDPHYTYTCIPESYTNTTYINAIHGLCCIKWLCRQK